MQLWIDYSDGRYFWSDHSNPIGNEVTVSRWFYWGLCLKGCLDRYFQNRLRQLDNKAEEARNS